ncbi:MAG: EAL domain-containing protein [Thermomicrobiales bacterium]
MRVALIESRSRTQQELLSMLGECELDAHLVEDPAELSATLDDGSFAAVIIGEPEGRSKSELIKDVRFHPHSARIAVIAIVADVDGPEAVSLIEAGADDAFSLPITTEDLHQTIRRSRWENTRDLEAAERHLRLIKPANLLIEVFSQAKDGYFIASETGEIIAASAGLAALTGFDTDELVGETIAGLGLTITPEIDSEEVSTEPKQMSFTLVTSDWRKIAVCAELNEIRLAGVRCHFGIIREEASSDGAAPHHARSIIQTITRNTNDALLIVDRSGQIQHLSKGFEQILGWNAEALQGRNLIDFVAPEDYAVVQPFSTGGVVHSGEIEGVRLLQENGELKTYNLSITELDQNPLLSGWLVSISAPSNTVLHQTRRLTDGGYYSLYDPVTALPNRLLFIDRLDHAIERSARIHSVMCCFVVSIDNFQQNIANLKPDDVRQILCEYGRRLHQTVREGDTVARVGDSDFAVLAEGVGGAAEARVLGDRIVDALRRPFETDSGPITLRSSVGASTSSPSGQNAGNLLRDATAAMEYSRNVGGGRCTVFEDRMRQSVVDSLRLEGDIDGIHQRGELQIFYQPEVDIKTEQVLAAEALIRWEHPRHGLILPGEFISLAEDSGQLNAIGLWIIETTCETLQGWRRRHPNAESLVGVVNLTAGQLEAPDFVDDVARILDRTGLPGANLRLEISENQHQNVERWREVAEELRAFGVQIGLQDINPATLTTELLDSMPVDTVKIDRTMMNTPVQDPSQPSRSRILAQSENDYSFRVVVSSIETAQHLARARILGYPQGQGFFFYRPVPAQTIEYMLIHGLNRTQGTSKQATEDRVPVRATA